MIRTLQAHSLRRAATMMERRQGLTADEAAVLTRAYLSYERSLVDSIQRFTPLSPDAQREAGAFLDTLTLLVARPAVAGAPQGDGRLVFRRNPQLKGPMSVFGYDYFLDKYGADRAAAVRLARDRGLRGSGGDYTYEALNLVDGRRTSQEIRDALSATYGPVPLDVVVEVFAGFQLIPGDCLGQLEVTAIPPVGAPRSGRTEPARSFAAADAAFVRSTETSCRRSSVRAGRSGYDAPGAWHLFLGDEGRRGHVEDVPSGCGVWSGIPRR